MKQDFTRTAISHIAQHIGPSVGDLKDLNDINVRNFKQILVTDGLGISCEIQLTRI